MKSINKVKQDLTVKGETIERLYINYVEDKYTVNRRYQRKLVWGIEEKKAFIDSISKKFPVPIILLAENIKSQSIEIIDGMQRLNAIFSFIEGEITLDNKYFDLESIASTKQLLDTGVLKQNLPKLDRAECVKITAYEVPMSIFEYSSDTDVDEVFRRINSGGRKLSRQELRAAGSLDDFSTATRKISASIRGDSSHSDILPLNKMKLISVASKDLGYGIDVDSVFWVSQGVLSKEEVRQSLDEQTIADILAYVISHEKPGSRSEYLDDYFGLRDTEASIKRFNEVNLLTRKIGIENLNDNFLKIIDTIVQASKKSGLALTAILFGQDAQPKAPRVFQIVFLALYEIIINNNMRVKSIDGLIEKLKKHGPKIQPQEGGRWGAEHRKDQVERLKKLILKEFIHNEESDPIESHWESKLNNLLTQSKTEQASYDFKQGFLELESPYKFDVKSLEKILKTCAGIANLDINAKGYVIVGISDSEETTERIKSIHGIESYEQNGFYINGIDHEATKANKTIDQYYQNIVDKIRQSPLDKTLKDHICRNIKCINYKEKSLIVFEVAAQEDPSLYNDELYIREGASIRKLAQNEFPNIYKRFARQ
ncbi:DUF262 domain-containing protein [Chromobacterium violaceum]|uniref:DUF262 domain-containing protein n=1 Tax=Chromobacterium violaceum TaxID=536 RepID=A0A202B9X0_CHRVL|nr:DUF262 domain-containing protein [Chromobacterium violaceum]OVE48161.1 hypothetical protein CBW21_11930 [Chromobacterium violaceum]